MRSILRVFAFITAAVSFSVARADVCPDDLLDNPYVDGVDDCVFSLLRSQPEQQQFAERLIHEVVYGKSGGNKGPSTPLDYEQLAELAALIETPKSIDAILNLVPADDETRSFAVARLYELRAPLVLERLMGKDQARQESTIFSIAWGVANNHYLFINTTNYERLAVGQHWELANSDHPHYDLARQISEEILAIIKPFAE